MGSFFIRRPIVAMVISIVMVIMGGVAITRLPVAQYPDITPPLIQVTTTYTGASALDVESSVAAPVEQQVNGVDNMIYMKSTNANDGTYNLQVSFEVGANLDMSNVLVQTRVSQAMASLPQDVKNYGVTVKKSLNFPLMLVTLTSPSGAFDNNFLSNYAAININDQLKRISGVGDVILFGGSDYAMRIWVRPDRLKTLGLTVADLSSAVKQQNVLLPAGQIGGPPAPKGTEFTYAVRTKGRLLDPQERLAGGVGPQREHEPPRPGLQRPDARRPGLGAPRAGRPPARAHQGQARPGDAARHAPPHRPLLRAAREGHDALRHRHAAAEGSAGRQHERRRDVPLHGRHQPRLHRGRREALRRRRLARHPLRRPRRGRRRPRCAADAAAAAGRRASRAVAAAAGAGARVANSVLGTEELTITGSLGTVTTTTVAAGDSAYTLANLVNSSTASTNVSAKAVTTASPSRASSRAFTSLA